MLLVIEISMTWQWTNTSVHSDYSLNSQPWNIKSFFISFFCLLPLFSLQPQFLQNGHLDQSRYEFLVWWKIFPFSRIQLIGTPLENLNINLLYEKTHFIHPFVQTCQAFSQRFDLRLTKMKSMTRIVQDIVFSFIFNYLAIE